MSDTTGLDLPAYEGPELDCQTWSNSGQPRPCGRRAKYIVGDRALCTHHAKRAQQLAEFGSAVDQLANREPPVGGRPARAAVDALRTDLVRATQRLARLDQDLRALAMTPEEADEPVPDTANAEIPEVVLAKARAHDEVLALLGPIPGKSLEAKATELLHALDETASSFLGYSNSPRGSAVQKCLTAKGPRHGRHALFTSTPPAWLGWYWMRSRATVEGGAPSAEWMERPVQVVWVDPEDKAVYMTPPGTVELEFGMPIPMPSDAAAGLKMTMQEE